MNTAKRIASFLLASTFLLAALTGCGNSDPTLPQQPGDSGSAPLGTLQLWTINKDAVTLEIMERAAANFEAETGYRIEITMTENDPYKTKLRTVMGGGDAPDIFHSWGGNWLKQFVDEGQVLEITDEVSDFKGDIYESLWSQTTYEDKVYGVPILLSGALVFYNKPMFEKYGLEFPNTWSEMETVSEIFVQNDIIPFSLGNSSKWPGALFFAYNALRLGSPDVFENALNRTGANNFQDPTFIQAGDFIKDMVDRSWIPEGANGINYDTGGSRMLFYTERAAMILITSQFIVNCFSENPEFFANNLAIAPYPAFENGAGDPTDVLCGNNSLSVSKNTQYPEQAIAFLKYFTTDPEINNAFANEANIMVSYKNADIQSPYVRTAIDILTGGYMQNYYDQALPVELGELHKDTTQALFGGEMTSEEAARQMEERARTLLGG